MSTTEDVDWAGVEQRGRRLQWLALPVVLLVVAAFAALQRSWSWAEVAVGAGVFAVLALLLVALAVRRPAGTQAEGRRVQYALRHHADPGGDLRERADQQARQFARSGWLGWVYPLLALGQVSRVDWDRPAVTVPGAVVLCAAFLGLGAWWLSMSRAARRWLADPPGPERVLPEPARWERWLGWRWLGVVAVGCLALGLLLGLLGALLD